MNAVSTTPGTGALVARTFDRFDMLPEEAWRHAAAHTTHPFLDPGWLRLVEGTLGDACRFRWVLFEESGGEPVAAAGFTVMTVDLAKLAPTSWRGFIGRYRKVRPRAGKLTLLMGGLPISNGFDCLAVRRELDPERFAAALAEATRVLTREHRAKLVVLKEFGPADASGLAPLERHGFRRIDSLPLHVLPREHDHFEAYYQSRSKRTRRNIRDYKRSAERFGIAFETRRGREGVAELMTGDVHRLYLAVFEKAALQFEELPSRFFAELATRFPDESRFTIARHGERIVGFVAGLAVPPHAVLLKVGYDTSFDPAANLYFALVYRALADALGQPVEEISIGQGADEFKRRLGCEPRPRHFYLKVPGLVTGTLARWIAPRMFPARPQTGPSDPPTG